MKKKIQPTVSMRRLRRLAPRAIYIIAKVRKELPALDAIADAMSAALQDFVRIYDLFYAAAPGARAEVQGGRLEVDRLQATIRTWLTIVGRDIPVNTTRYHLHTEVPEDVIAAGRLLVQAIRDTMEAGVSLSYGPTAIEALERAIATAEKEWHEARTAITERQAEGAALRQAAASAQAELVALRQVIHANLGRSNLDYQALRADRGGSDAEDEDDSPDVSGDTVEVPVVPAPDADRESDDRESGEFSAPASVAS